RAAVVDEQRDHQRLLGTALEDGDLLLRPIIEDLEIALFQRPDEASGAVFHGGEDADQADIHAKGGLLREGESAKGEHGGRAQISHSHLAGYPLAPQPWAHSDPTLLPPIPRRRRSAPSSRPGPGVSGD